MRNKRWNPAQRHTVLGEPGNEAWLEARVRERRKAEQAEAEWHGQRARYRKPKRVIE